MNDTHQIIISVINYQWLSYLFSSFIADKEYSMCISVYNIGNNGTLDKVSLITKTGAILSVYPCVMRKSEPTVKCCISLVMPYGVSKFGEYCFMIWLKTHMEIPEAVNRKTDNIMATIATKTNKAKKHNVMHKQVYRNLI